MATGDPIPDPDHLARAVGRGFDKDEVTSAAFCVRDIDNLKLSADWVECVYADPNEASVKGSLSRLRRGSLKSGQQIALLNAVRIRGIEAVGPRLDAIEDPHPNWPCHSAIVGFTGEESDMHLQQGLADLANSGRIVTLS